MVSTRVLASVRPETLAPPELLDEAPAETLSTPLTVRMNRGRPFGPIRISGPGPSGWYDRRNVLPSSARRAASRTIAISDGSNARSAFRISRAEGLIVCGAAAGAAIDTAIRTSSGDAAFTGTF